MVNVPNRGTYATYKQSCPTPTEELVISSQGRIKRKTRPTNLFPLLPSDLEPFRAHGIAAATSAIPGPYDTMMLNLERCSAEVTGSANLFPPT